MPGPLAGVKVIDVSAILSGPLAAMMLADQGAEVIKVEPPGIGDLMRIGAYQRGGLSAFFANANRGKRSIVLDLGKPRGVELLLELVRDADVFIQNFRPGAVERLGIDEPQLRAVNPDLIYVSISGYGDSGPYRDRRVYDPIIQGLTGHVAVQSNPQVPIPDVVRNVVADKSSAYTAAQAITAALYAREKGAGGQHVQIPMIDASLAFFWPDGMMAHTLLAEDTVPGPTLYQVMGLTETGDGHLIYFAASDAEFHGLFRALKHPEWAEDARFVNPAARGRPENFAKLGELLAAEFRKWSTAEILERMLAEQVPAGPVHSLEAMVQDPQILHNQAYLEREHPTAGTIRQPRVPARFDKTPAEPGRLPPLHGEHTDEILAELGLGAAEREKLRAQGVAGVG
jgi:crotonobetainyl-CoA:carnitine CoA-transferase CaiB-like acyl-CoA transferase